MRNSNEVVLSYEAKLASEKTEHIARILI